MPAHRLDHVGLTVADLPAMTRWWCDALAMTVEFEFALEHVDFSGVMLRSPAGFRLELLHRSGNLAGLQAADPVDAALTRGFGHVAFDVPDVDTAYAALVDAGASDRMSPRPSPEPGVRMAYVADPEGNLVELLDRTTALSSVEPSPSSVEPVETPPAQVRRLRGLRRSSLSRPASSRRLASSVEPVETFPSVSRPTFPGGLR